MSDPPFAFSREDLKATVREAVREEMAALGLRAEEPDQVFDAREDIRFLRRLRRAVDDAAGKVGMAVILAITAASMSALWLGVKTLVGRP